MVFIGSLNLPLDYKVEIEPIDQIGDILNDENEIILVSQKFVITNENILSNTNLITKIRNDIGIKYNSENPLIFSTLLFKDVENLQNFIYEQFLEMSIQHPFNTGFNNVTGLYGNITKKFHTHISNSTDGEIRFITNQSTNNDLKNYNTYIDKSGNLYCYYSQGINPAMVGSGYRNVMDGISQNSLGVFINAASIVALKTYIFASKNKEIIQEAGGSIFDAISAGATGAFSSASTLSGLVTGAGGGVIGGTVASYLINKDHLQQQTKINEDLITQLNDLKGLNLDENGDIINNAAYQNLTEAEKLLLIDQIELLLITELEEERQLTIDQYNLFGLLNVDSILNYEKLLIPPLDGFLNYNNNEWIVSNKLNYEKLSIPLKDNIVTVLISSPITTEPLINIDDNYKYVRFNNSTANQTIYSIEFQEETEIQLLLLDSTKYKTTSYFNISGIVQIIVGQNGSFSSFGDISTENGINYSFYINNNITGISTSYVNSVVIVKYKYTKNIIEIVPNIGYLNYKITGWEINDIEEIIINNSNFLNNKINTTSNFLNNKINTNSNLFDQRIRLNLQVLNVLVDSQNELVFSINNLVNERTNNILISQLQPPIFPSSTYPILDPIVNDSLVLNYKFKDNYLDSSGNESHLRNFNTTFINENLTTSYINFSNSSYLEIPNSFNPYNTWNNNFGITISIKIRTTSCTTWGRIIDFQPSLNSTAGILIARPGNENNLRVQITNSIFRDVPYTWDTNEWRHIVFSISATGIWSLYINNINQNITPITQAIPNLGYNVMYINRSVYTGDGFWTGQLEHLKIYKKVLSLSEIGLLFNGNEILPILFPIIRNSTNKSINFLNTGANITSYNIDFLEDTICDILIVGGGGAGGSGTNNGHESGGGGGGGVVFMVNKVFKTGTYKINVGKGGLGIGGTVDGSTNGFSSSITEFNNVNKKYDNIDLIGRGGGAGAQGGNFNGKTGGSGGGGSHNQTNGGLAIQGNTRWNGSSYLPGGYSGRKPIAGSRGGGGGGATESGDTDGIGQGGDGFSGYSGFNFMGNFGLDVGHNFFGEDNTYFGGGGGGAIPPTASYFPSQGGGGIPNTVLNVSANFMSGLPNTGGGGAGSLSNGNILGGNGGSGVVILRFRSTKIINTITSSIIYENNLWRPKNSLWENINHDIFYNNGNVNINGIENKFYKLFVGGNARCDGLDVMNNLNVYNNINVKTINVSDNIIINRKMNNGSGDVTRLIFYANNQSGVFPANGMALNFTTNSEHGPNSWTGADFLKVFPEEYIFNGLTYSILLQTQRSKSGDWWSEFWLKRNHLELRRRQADDGSVNECMFFFNITNGRLGIGNTSPGGVIHISSSFTNLDGFITWVVLMNSNNAGGWAMCADNNNTWNLNLYWFAVTNSGGWARIMAFENDISNRGTGGIFAFTGQHPVFINNITYKDIDDKIGLIVCANNNDYININGKEICRGNNAISINESLPICSLCIKHKDKSCFGVISYGEDPESRNQLNGRIRAYFEKELGDTRIYINSVGEGALWVSNKNGNLESGDYITSSSIIGYGEKQDDDILHNYTVAKITMDCDFNPLFKPIKKIKKNYVDEIVYRVIIPLDKKDKIDRMNYNYIFDTETNFCYYDITVEKYNLLTEKVFFEWDINDKKLYSYLIKNSLLNDLENDLIQWDDSIEYEYEYNIRYLDNENNIILKDTYDNLISNNIICWIAAFVGCTYHCG